MKLSNLITVLILVCSSAFGAQAQDKIYLLSGDVVNGKVKEITRTTVGYYLEDQEDPLYVVPKKKVKKIAYENGTTEDFGYRNGPDRRPSFNSNDEPTKQKEELHFGKNILSVAMVQMSNEGAAGFGIHYERVMDSKGIFSLYLPLAFNFNRTNAYDPLSGMYSSSHYNTFIAAYPGVKIYPTGSQGRVKYSVGPSLAFSSGNQYITNHLNNSEKVSIFKMGLLLNNGLNVQATPHLYMGIEFGLGFYYFNEENDYNYQGYDNSGEPMVQFNFKMGYRF